MRGSRASSLDPRVSEFMVQLAANTVPARTTRVQIPLADAFFRLQKPTSLMNEGVLTIYGHYGIYNIAVHTGYVHIG